MQKWPHLSKNALLTFVSNGDSYVIPNIVHFIWFAKHETKEMTFLNFISILSAYKIQKPDTIYLHCNHLPSGQWWERLWQEVPIRLVFKEPPTTIHGQKLLHTYHQGDVAKMEVLSQYGGIYLDYDVIVLHSFNPLRKFDAVMGKEKPPKLNAGVILSSKNSVFLQLLKQSYKNNYRPLDWDYNCARLAYKIAMKRQDLVHIEPFGFTTPDWGDRRLLWNEAIDWSKLYVMHVMGHFDWNEHSPQSIKSQNSTFGQVMRFIYYGSAQLISTWTHSFEDMWCHFS